MTTLDSRQPGLDPTATTTDDATMRAFEQGTLDPAQFSHRVHLSLAWRYLQRDGFPEGAQQFRHHLQRYVTSVGAEDKYHETITWAYLVLLNEERCLRAAPGESFETMILRRPDLLDHRNGPIMRRYGKSQLDSPEARTVFMLPAVTTVDERGQT